MVDSLATQGQTCTPTTQHKNIMESTVSVDAKSMSLSHSICGILGLESCEVEDKSTPNHQDTATGDGQDDSNKSKSHTTTVFIVRCY